MSFKDHFSAKAAGYAKARPTYPPELFQVLASLAPGRSLAWDAGTGNGQAAVALAAHFERVVATDPSAAQLAAAVAHPGVTYRQCAERALELADGSVDIATVAQAVHWFDLKEYYPEVRRVLRPGGLLAMWNYAVCHIDAEIDPLLGHFYTETVGPYWPPERKHAETSYRNFEFPFAELAFPKINLTVRWTAAEFAAYLRTWSSVTRYTAARGADPVTALEPGLSRRWGPGRRTVVWPIGGRLGRGE